jgi:hypothetical protein
MQEGKTMTDIAQRTGQTLGSVRAILQFEALVALATILVAYWLLGFSWWWFLALILAPDLGMIGFLAGPRIGAWCYNAFHSYAAPAAIAIPSYLLLSEAGVMIGLIWAAHIAADRAIGYGLKYTSHFKHTHLA